MSDVDIQQSLGSRSKEGDHSRRVSNHSHRRSHYRSRSAGRKKSGKLKQAKKHKKKDKVKRKRRSRSRSKSRKKRKREKRERVAVVAPSSDAIRCVQIFLALFGGQVDALRMVMQKLDNEEQVVLNQMTNIQMRDTLEGLFQALQLQVTKSKGPTGTVHTYSKRKDMGRKSLFRWIEDLIGELTVKSVQDPPQKPDVPSMKNSPQGDRQVDEVIGNVESVGPQRSTQETARVAIGPQLPGRETPNLSIDPQRPLPETVSVAIGPQPPVQETTRVAIGPQPSVQETTRVAIGPQPSVQETTRVAIGPQPSVQETTRVAIGPQRPVNNAKCSSIGPKSQAEIDSSNIAHDERRMASPSQRCVVAAEESDEDIGPAQIGETGFRQASAIAKLSSQLAAREFEEKRNERRSTTKTENGREAWMTELPDDRVNVLPSLEAGNRSFRAKAVITDEKARSEWTRLPGQGDDQVKPTQSKPEILPRTRAAISSDPKLQEFEAKHRNKSLLEEHREAIAIRESSRNSKPKEWSWDRDRDFVQGEVDMKYTNKILSDKMGLKTRFSKGSN